MPLDERIKKLKDSVISGLQKENQLLKEENSRLFEQIIKDRDAFIEENITLQQRIKALEEKCRLYYNYRGSSPDKRLQLYEQEIINLKLENKPK